MSWLDSIVLLIVSLPSDFMPNALFSIHGWSSFTNNIGLFARFAVVVGVPIRKGIILA